MKPDTPKESFHRVTRWMITNLELSSGIYRTTDGRLQVDPALSISSSGEIARSTQEAPPDCAGWEMNSATALLACCYIDALGKVLQRDNKDAGNSERFQTFINAHMREFVHECEQKGAGHTPHDLYSTYRCGFVHQFAEMGAHWGRRGRLTDYWFYRDDTPALNVDRFVTGVATAIREFRREFPVDSKNGSDPYKNFFKWLGANS